MRINIGQATSLFHAGAINRSISPNHTDEGQQAGTFIRSDLAMISPQGKSASLLANLMNQKELIQSNKESLLAQSLDEEGMGSSAGLQEQLEEYEKQLDTINEQIAAEMAKQAEPLGEQSGIVQNPHAAEKRDSDDDEIAELTKMSVDLEKAQTADQARVRREGEKRVCESELKLGSVAAERKLDKIKEVENLTGKLEPLWRKGLIK